MTTPQQLPESRKLGLVATERVAQLRERKADPAKYQPVPTPWQDLNRIINGGLPKQDPCYVVILGMDKVGKSTLIKQLFMQHATLTGFKAGFYDLEETVWQTADRAMLMSSTTVQRSDIYKINLTEENLDYLEETARLLQHEEIYVNDQLYVAQQIIKHAVDNQFKIIGIDNYQLMTGGVGKDSREKLEFNSKLLMRATHKYGLTTIMAAQGNTKDGVFGSSQGLRDCDFMFEMDNIWQKVEGERGKGVALNGVRTVRVKRSRHSVTGEIELIFEPEYSRLKDSRTKPLFAVEASLDFEGADRTEYEEIIDGEL